MLGHLPGLFVLQMSQSLAFGRSASRARASAVARAKHVGNLEIWGGYINIARCYNRQAKGVPSGKLT